MKKLFFRSLALINRAILPRMSKVDITRLTKMQKAIVAWRYRVTINAIE